MGEVRNTKVLEIDSHAHVYTFINARCSSVFVLLSQYTHKIHSAIATQGLGIRCSAIDADSLAWFSSELLN